jgi:branched-chain amino acid transport system permease protein
VAAFCVPALGSRFYYFLANDVVIWALFATSLNLLVGYTGLVSFGHAAYFGIGAYTTGILMKKLGLSFLVAFPAAGLVAALFAVVLRLLLRAAHAHLLRHADAGLRPDRLGHLLQVERGDRRRAGHAGDPLPQLRLGGEASGWLPFLGGYRTSDYFYFLCIVLVAVALWVLRRIVGSPFGRMLTTIRENPERAEFIGVNVRRYELAAFVLAGAFAGLAGGCSASSIGESSPTSPTGPSPPRCSS